MSEADQWLFGVKQLEIGGREDYKGQEETFGGDIFMDVYICQYLLNYTL